MHTANEGNIQVCELRLGNKVQAVISAPYIRLESSLRECFPKKLEKNPKPTRSFYILPSHWYNITKIPFPCPSFIPGIYKQCSRDCFHVWWGKKPNCYLVYMHMEPCITERLCDLSKITQWVTGVTTRQMFIFSSLGQQMFCSLGWIISYKLSPYALPSLASLKHMHIAQHPYSHPHLPTQTHTCTRSFIVEKLPESCPQIVHPSPSSAHLSTPSRYSSHLGLPHLTNTNAGHPVISEF